MATTSTNSGKIKIAVGTMIVMGLLAIFALSTGSIVMIIIHKIMANQAGAWSCVALVVCIAYDVVLFSNWHPWVAKLNNFFFNWK